MAQADLAAVGGGQHQGDSDQPTRTDVYLRAFRANGSEVIVRRRESPHHEWKESKTILDLPGRKRVTVSEFTETLTTYPLSDDDVSFYRSWPKSEYTGRLDLVRSKFPSYEVRKVHKQLDAETLLESLMAPALDCFALQENWTLGPAGRPRHRVSRQALHVIEGEPAAALFEIPTTYVERAPSEVAAEFARRYPEQELFPPETAQKMD